MPLSAYVTTGTSTEDEAIPSGKDLGLLWKTLFGARVEFIHRTAADFLAEAEAGKNIIRVTTPQRLRLGPNLFNLNLSVHSSSTLLGTTMEETLLAKSFI